MKIVLMGPIRSHFQLNAGVQIAATRLYRQAWDSAYQDIKTVAQQHRLLVDDHSLRHVSAKVDTAPYTDIDRDTLPMPVEAIDLRVSLDEDLAHKAALEAYGDCASGQSDTDILETVGELRDGIRLANPQSGLNVRVYDNTISIVQVEVTVPDTLLLSAAGSSVEFHRKMEVFLVSFATHIIRAIYCSRIFPVLEAISEHPALAEHVMRIRGNQQSVTTENTFSPTLSLSTAPATEVCWITRNLIVPRAPQSECLVRTWLRAVGEDNPEQRVLDPDAPGYSLRWVNYAMTENFVQCADYEDAWEAMLLCQYFYAVTDTFSNNLKYLLAASHGNRGGKLLRPLYNDIDDQAARSEFLLMHMTAVRKYLRRTKENHVSEILHAWKHDTLLEDLRRTQQIAEGRLTKLFQRSSARASAIGDTFLAFIGVFAALDFVLNLAMVGRTLFSDATMGFRDKPWISVMGAVAAASVDGMLLGTSALVLILLLFYWRTRSRRIG